MEKRPILSTLRAMKVGEIEKFPLEQYNSISTVMYNNLATERSKGMRWSVKSIIDEGIMTVTRMS